METKKFTVIIEGDLDKYELEEALYQGFQFYEDIKWKAFSIKEDKTNEKTN